jgi:hypothetical protein
MSQIIMFARVGDEDIHVGKCTHAQARIITKKGHGEVEDGKLRLNIRPVHLEVAERAVHEPTDPNVSKKELQRRIEWLRGLMGAVALTEAPDATLLRERWKISLLDKRQRERELPTEGEVSSFNEDLDGLAENPIPHDPPNLAELWFGDMTENQLVGALEMIKCPSNWDAPEPTRDVRETPEYRKCVDELMREGRQVL